MIVSAVEIEVSLQTEHIQSLKEKRSIVQSMLKKTSQKFNVSIAETSQHDDFNVIVIGVVSVSNSKRKSDKVIQDVVNFIETYYNLDLSILTYEI